MTDIWPLENNRYMCLDSKDEYRSTATLDYKILNLIELTNDFIEDINLEDK